MGQAAQRQCRGTLTVPLQIGNGASQLSPQKDREQLRSPSREASRIMWHNLFRSVLCLWQFDRKHPRPVLLFFHTTVHLVWVSCVLVSSLSLDSFLGPFAWCACSLEGCMCQMRILRFRAELANNWTRVTVLLWSCPGPFQPSRMPSFSWRRCELRAIALYPACLFYTSGCHRLFRDSFSNVRLAAVGIKGEDGVDGDFSCAGAIACFGCCLVLGQTDGPNGEVIEDRRTVVRSSTSSLSPRRTRACINTRRPRMRLLVVWHIDGRSCGRSTRVDTFLCVSCIHVSRRNSHRMDGVPQVGFRRDLSMGR